ncbi:hypothetical protein IMCC1989_2678 [gamma proteobacterium IMCC1989]|nr:hypothetical protein IMCC1989_2678 [gamma proteobacterium IMCC1989]
MQEQKARSMVVTKDNGSRGVYGIAQQELGSNATQAQINQRVDEIVELNPQLRGYVNLIRPGDELNLGNGSPVAISDATRVARVAGDESYQASLAIRTSQAALVESNIASPTQSSDPMLDLLGLDTPQVRNVSILFNDRGEIDLSGIPPVEPQYTPKPERYTIEALYNGRTKTEHDKYINDSTLDAIRGNLGSAVTFIGAKAAGVTDPERLKGAADAGGAVWNFVGARTKPTLALHGINTSPPKLGGDGVNTLPSSSSLMSTPKNKPPLEKVLNIQREPLPKVYDGQDVKVPISDKSLLLPIPKNQFVAPTLSNSSLKSNGLSGSTNKTTREDLQAQLPKGYHIRSYSKSDTLGVARNPNTAAYNPKISLTPHNKLYSPVTQQLGPVYSSNRGVNR